MCGKILFHDFNYKMKNVIFSLKFCEAVIQGGALGHIFYLNHCLTEAEAWCT